MGLVQYYLLKYIAMDSTSMIVGKKSASTMDIESI